MASGYKTQLTRQVGEHLVVSELGKRGIIATPFAGNVPHFDLLAADEFGKALPVQVKAINGPSWQFDATTFLEIEVSENWQTVTGKKRFSMPKLPCVFVHLNNPGNRFYIFEWQFLQNYFYKHYKGGLRPKNPKSTHCAIWPKHLEEYLDNWKIITDYFKKKH